MSGAIRADDSFFDGVWKVLVAGDGPSDRSHDADNGSSFLPGTPIDWCENNYEISPHIAEFWNTTSNIAYLAVGYVCLRQCIRQALPTPYYLLSLFIIGTGIFSAFFHGTLWLVGQRLDEIFENAMLAALYRGIDIDRASAVSWSITIHSMFVAMGICAVTMFLLCEVHLIGVSVLIGRKLRQHVHPFPPLRMRFQRAIMYVALGGIFWILDRLCCGFLQNLPFGMPNPQLHSAWHIFTALGLYECFALVTTLHKLHHGPSKRK